MLITIGQYFYWMYLNQRVDFPFLHSRSAGNMPFADEELDILKFIAQQRTVKKRDVK